MVSYFKFTMLDIINLKWFKMLDKQQNMMYNTIKLKQKEIDIMYTNIEVKNKMEVITDAVIFDVIDTATEIKESEIISDHTVESMDEIIRLSKAILTIIRAEKKAFKD